MNVVLVQVYLTNSVHINDIKSNIYSLMESMGIKCESKTEDWPPIFSSPKFHKAHLKFRYVISYSSCSIRPLAVSVSLALKAIYSEISPFTRMLFKKTSLNRNRVILNNKPILDAIEEVNEKSAACNLWSSRTNESF